MTDNLKILFLDIETAPAKVWTYNFFDASIGPNQIIDPPRIICYSAQWYGSKKTLYRAEWDTSRAEMLQSLWELLTEADLVVGYNSKRFDIPWITGEFMAEGLQAPAPFKQIDLYQVMKQHSRFPSKKLDYVLHRLLNDQKIQVNTMELAIQCLAGDEKARKLMERYSKKDTAAMLPLFDRVKSYLKLPHPVQPGLNRCRNCGSLNLHRRGYALTLNGTYQRVRCVECGTWGRTLERDTSTNIRNIA